MNDDSQKQYLKAFGHNLRRIRNSKGLTMEELAGRAEIEYRQLGRIERGEINTTILTLNKLAKNLDIEIQQLFIFWIDE